MKTPITLLLTALAFNATATDYTCTNAGNERAVSVVYTTPGQVVPCEVVYDKDGSSQTLWRASNEAGYCEARADAFAEKLRTLGWDCQTAAADMTTEEEGPAEGADGN